MQLFESLQGIGGARGGAVVCVIARNWRARGCAVVCGTVLLISGRDIGYFHSHNPSGCTTPLVPTWRLKE